MFGIGGGNIFNIAAQVAMGVATGGSSIAMQMAMRAVMSAVGQQLLQQMGQSLGLPQSMIDMAQASFCSACGDTMGAQQNLQEAIGGLGEAAGFSPFETGALQNQLDNYIAQLVLQAAQEFGQSGGREQGQAGG
ncbi:MAG: hypothetical protein AAF205_13180, partial [Pseudomonadota bacterium]